MCEKVVKNDQQLNPKELSDNLIKNKRNLINCNLMEIYENSVFFSGRYAVIDYNTYGQI